MSDCECDRDEIIADLEAAYRQIARTHARLLQLEAVIAVECDCRLIETCRRCEAIDTFVAAAKGKGKL